MAATSPTARTLAWARKQGWIAGVVEKWIPQTKQRKDLFGCIDLICIDPKMNRVFGIQATTGANLSSRLEKAKLLETTPIVCRSMTLLFIGWRQVGAKGKRKLWEPRVQVLTGGYTVPGHDGLEWTVVDYKVA